MTGGYFTQVVGSEQEWQEGIVASCHASRQRPPTPATLSALTDTLVSSAYGRGPFISGHKIAIPNTNT